MRVLRIRNSFVEVRWDFYIKQVLWIGVSVLPLSQTEQCIAIFTFIPIIIAASFFSKLSTSTGKLIILRNVRS